MPVMYGEHVAGPPQVCYKPARPATSLYTGQLYSCIRPATGFFYSPDGGQSPPAGLS